jgi:hypothetical protein
MSELQRNRKESETRLREMMDQKLVAGHSMDETESNNEMSL